MKSIHLVARARPGLRPLILRPDCVALWRRLRKRFPRVFACVFMPDLIHLIVVSRAPLHSRRDLATELRAFTRQRYPGRKLWLPLPLPEILPDSLHLRRTIRYVHLNPCRARLVRDPLCWEWSTHRDALGAAAPGWVDSRAVAEHFGSAERFHRYVSADPAVSVEGTPAPRRAHEGADLGAGLDRILLAACLATRSDLAELKRASATQTLAVHLATRNSPASHREIAQRLAVSLSSLHRARRRRADPEALDAALLVIQDARLLKSAASNDIRSTRKAN